MAQGAAWLHSETCFWNVCSEDVMLNIENVLVTVLGVFDPSGVLSIPVRCIS